MNTAKQTSEMLTTLINDVREGKMPHKAAHEINLAIRERIKLAAHQFHYERETKPQNVKVEFFETA